MILDQYEKDGFVIEAHSLITTQDDVINIKQIAVLGTVAYLYFDSELQEDLKAEPADEFIRKNLAHMHTLTKITTPAETSCNCPNCH
jgi:hypothetical protein